VNEPSSPREALLLEEARLQREAPTPHTAARDAARDPARSRRWLMSTMACSPTR
jgi:hypothetical protein